MAEGVLATVNFGSRPKEAFDKLKEYQPDGPLMCMEYWNGWFDHWFEPHHTRDAEDAARVLDDMLGMGASVNFYMVHGGRTSASAAAPTTAINMNRPLQAMIMMPRLARPEI